MRKGILIILLIIIAGAGIIYITGRTGQDDTHTEPPPPVPQVLTRMDSLVMTYDTLLTTMLDSLGTAGSAVAITWRGQIVYQECFGVREWGTRDSVDENTVFRLASVSKAVTGVLASILDERGDVSLDDPVMSHLPGFTLKDSVNTWDLTIRNILSHTSGLVPHAYDNLVEDGVPIKVIIDSLFRVNISAPPGQLYGYQNVMFSLYDTILYRQIGIPAREIFRKNIFIPFGMDDASTSFRGMTATANHALPHYRSGKEFRLLPENDRYYTTVSAAGINASISDMAKFLKAILARDPVTGSFMVPETAFTPQVRSPLRWNYLRHWDGVDSKHYGLGWRIIGYRGMTVAYHGGYVLGYRAELAVCRDEELGIAYLTNSPNSIGGHVVPMLLDLYDEWGMVD